MEIKLAIKDDLSQIKEILNAVIENLDNNNISIWNKYYPYEAYAEDIDENRLYLLKEKNEIIGLISLLPQSIHEDDFKWGKGRALFISRFVINLNYQRMGYAKYFLDEIIKIAKDKKADMLRLTVVKINKPAVSFYEKYGFKKVYGIYQNPQITKCDNTEFGYELKIKNT